MPDIIPIINCNLQWRQRQAIYAKQGEYGARKVKIFLYNGSNSYEIPDSGISAVFAYKRPDGFSDSYDTIDGVDAIALSPSDNSATVTLAQNVLAVPGTVECELQLLTSGAMIATFTFYIIVEASVSPGTEPSEQTTNPFVRSPADIGSGYAICSTAAATAAKTATIDGYRLVDGGRTSVKFTYAVPANATLNISDTGAKDIYYHGNKVGGSLISAGDLVTFVYDATNSRYHVSAIDASNSGGGGVTPESIVSATGDMTVQQAADTRENINAGTYSKPGGGIPAADLASDAKPFLVKITVSGGVYSADKTEAQILAAVAAKQVVICKAPEGYGYFANDDDGTEFFVLYGSASAKQIYRYVINGSTVSKSKVTVYEKPSGGIPENDLASAVQNKLPLRVTISWNGSIFSSDKTFSEVSAAEAAGHPIDVAIDNMYGWFGDITNDTATFFAIEKNSGGAPSLYTFELTASGVSSTMKTLGDEIAPTKTTVSGSTPSIAAAANTVYTCGELTSLTIISVPAIGEFSVIFTSGSTATTVSLPATLKMPSFTIEANMIYELNVMDGRGLLAGWSST